MRSKEEIDRALRLIGKSIEEEYLARGESAMWDIMISKRAGIAWAAGLPEGEFTQQLLDKLERSWRREGALNN